MLVYQQREQLCRNLTRLQIYNIEEQLMKWKFVYYERPDNKHVLISRWVVGLLK
jgi:hypothetical protein